MHPSKSPADLMPVVKAGSSGWIHDTIPEMPDFAWQTGYGSFTVSRSGADDVTAYIANQAEHHRTRTFEEEYLAFLDRHGIEYARRYVFE